MRIMVCWMAVVVAGAGLARGEVPRNVVVPPGSHVDNSGLMPKVLPDSQVKMEGLSPDWVKSLVMMQFRIETVTPVGTFAAAAIALNHCAEAGVNGIWVNPIWERGSKGNGYGNFGPNAIEPLLTGSRSIEGSYAAVRKFVDEAHKRNIRVVFDIIVWGTHKDSPLVKEHPEFYRKEGGEFVTVWGGWMWDWQSPALRKWFTDAAVKFIEETGADGFRVDLAPDSSGYFFKEVRDELYKRGKKVLIVAECGNERKETFDFEQDGVTGWTEEADWPHPENFQKQKEKFGRHNEYLFRPGVNIVDVVKTGVGVGKATLQQEGKGGMFRFYTSNMLNHDDPAPFVKGSRVKIGYGAIFAPYIPMWWIGEEWNNPQKSVRNGGGVMYFNEINWGTIDRGDNRAFYEDVKRFIRIRRCYPEIFEYFPDNARQANIAKLDTSCDGQPNPLQAYARFAAGKAVLVVPNTAATGTSNFEIKPDYAALQLTGAKEYKITDLLTGKVLLQSPQPPASFTAHIEADRLGVYLVEAK